MFYICYLYLFTYTGVQHDFHVKWWSRRLTVTRRVSRVEQKLLTLPKHLCSPLVLSGVRGARSLVVCVVVCKSLFVLLSLFFWPLCCLFFCLLAIVLSVLLSFGHCVVCSSLFTASDYPFGIFKPFNIINHFEICYIDIVYLFLNFNATPKPICLLSASIVQFYYIVW